MGINYKKCPNCGSINSIKIIYGYPSYELSQEEEAGKVRLGGCCIFEGMPEYFCKDCQHEWNYEQAVDSAYNRIKSLKASVGGFFNGECTAEIDFENLTITWTHFGGGNEEKTLHKNIRKTTADKCIEELKMADLLNWKARYMERDICDGTQWSVEIKTEGRTIKKQGSNMFPQGWKMFCKIISNITNNNFNY